MNDLLQGVNIYLIGMMGAGKTTIGKRLSKKLSYRFSDTDTAIEAIARTKISEIFAIEGETYFRELETKVLSELSIYTRCVVSTGGGIVEKRTNWSYLRQGLIIWLNTDLEILRKRLASDTNRPLASKLETLFTSRYPLYAQADLTIDIDTNRSPDDIADKIVEMIPSVLKLQSPINNQT